MKILVTASQVPYETGGAWHHIQGTVKALANAGHQVELVQFPFKFFPEDYLQQQMDYLKKQNFQSFTHHNIDRVISLQFPGYGIQHPNHILWVMHQHRAVYDLYDPKTASPEQKALRQSIQNYDQQALSNASKLYANSKQVAQRIKQHHQLEAIPLYHPPPQSQRYYTAKQEGYIFYPSRQEPLKRQQLLIQAAQHLQTPVKLLLAGTGTQHRQNQQLIRQLKLENRVRLLGAITETQKYTYYAHALAVFFGPYDEDYGYITLEAQLSEKPVITCTDSGGPLEFINHREQGLIVEPDPETLAHAMDWLYLNPQAAKEMGKQGKVSYQEKEISWKKVIHQLLE